ncbi:MAG: hypothetical protein M1837_004336 [Sclerophora amabilis]|nr:MAG: hypothetical protein M1837_004336 [Sclerophora amabilis]
MASPLSHVATAPSASSAPSAPSRDALLSRTRSHASSASSTGSRLRSASFKFLDSNPPSGMWHATGEVAARAPTFGEIRRGSFGHAGWSNEEQYERRTSSAGSEEISRRRSSRSGSSPTIPSGFIKARRTGTNLSGKTHDIQETAAEHQAGNISSNAREQTDRSEPTATHKSAEKGETPGNDEAIDLTQSESHVSTNSHSSTDSGSASPPVYQNGYAPPPKHTWGQATSIGLRAFWKFFLTPLGFLVTLYGLNVVAWGGMLFLLLCNAAPAMCNPDCNDINSPRRVWIEIDSQILNALFCVTGFGLVPWRFRDLYYLLKWRIFKRHDALQRLAGIHRGWFRLAGSDKIPFAPAFSPSDQPSTRDDMILAEFDSSIPIPPSRIPDPPPTGTRAPPTSVWKLDFVIWMYVGNTFLQTVLSGFMWGLNRYDRPSWSTGLFVALACIVAGIGGLMVFFEGKRVKKVEGVPEGLPGAADGAIGAAAVDIEKKAAKQKKIPEKHKETTP